MLATAVIGASLLLTSPVHGLGDNGAFQRVLTNNGLFQLPGTQADYVTARFGFLQGYVKGRETGLSGVSSRHLFIQLAILLNKLIVSSTVFDIRCLGLVYLGLLVGAVGLLTRALTRTDQPKRSYGLAALIVLVLADTTVLLPFNSFYTMPLLVILSVTMVASLLLLGRAPEHRGRWISLYFVSAALLVTSQPQNALLTLSYLVMSLGSFVAFRHPAQRLGLLCGGVGLVACGVLMGLALTPQQRQVNRYQAFTHGVLQHAASDPSPTLKQRGIDPQFALMRGDDYFSADFTALDPASSAVATGLTKKMTFSWIFKYYATHFAQLQQLLNLAATHMLETRVTAVGNYPARSGHGPKAQVQGLTLVSAGLARFFPRRFAFDLLLVGTLLTLFGVGAYRDWQVRRSAGVVRLTLMTGCLLNFLLIPIVVLLRTGETNLVQNIYLAPISLELVGLVLIADLATQRFWCSPDQPVMAHA